MNNLEVFDIFFESVKAPCLMSFMFTLSMSRDKETHSDTVVITNIRNTHSHTPKIRDRHTLRNTDTDAHTHTAIGNL